VAAVVLSSCAPLARSIAVGARAAVPVLAASAVWVPNSGDGTISIVDLRTLTVRRTVTLADPGAYLASGCVYGGGFRISEHNFPIGYFSARACEVPTAAVLAGGWLWVARNDQAALERLDPRTGSSLGTVPIAAQPWAMAPQRDVIWITDYFGGQVLRFDTRTATVTNRVKTIPGGPTGIITTSDAVYVVSSSDPAISRLDPETARIVATRPLGTRPLPVAFGAGLVWVRDEGEGALRWIDPFDLTELGSVKVGSFFGRDGLDAIAFDGEGIWVCSLALRRVNARTKAVDRELDLPCVAAVYGYGALWVLDLTGKLARVAI
jgi:outer membrane protein assembly factor BamB